MDERQVDIHVPKAEVPEIALATLAGRGGDDGCILPTSSNVDEVRDALRARCIESLYFLAKLVGFNDLTVDLHGMIAREVQSDVRLLLMLIARGHFKSSVGTIAGATWELINDLPKSVPADLTVLPDCNDRILLTNASEALVARFLTRIKGIWERNETFRWLFPETIPDFRTTTWSAESMLIRRSGEFPEPSIHAIGAKGKITGWHGNRQIWDDLIEREAAESETVMQKAIDFFKTTFSLFDDPEHDIGRMYGTPWTHNDLYRHIAEEMPYDEATGYGFKIITRSAVEDGKPIFPQRFSFDYLKYLQKIQGPRLFNLQYMCSFDDPSIKEFDIELLRTYTFDAATGKLRFSALNPATGQEELLETTIWQMDRIGLVDPALGEDKKKIGSRAAPAIVMSGTLDIFGAMAIFLLPHWTGQVTTDKQVDKIYELNGQLKPRGWIVEPFAFQKSMVHFIRRRNEEGKHGYVNVIDVPRATFGDKIVRMRGLIPFLGTRKIYVPEGSFEFLKQLDRAPYGKPIDLVDAFSMGLHAWINPGVIDVGEDDEENPYGTYEAAREACVSRAGY